MHFGKGSEHLPNENLVGVYFGDTAKCVFEHSYICGNNRTFQMFWSNNPDENMVYSLSRYTTRKWDLLNYSD